MIHNIDKLFLNHSCKDCGYNINGRCFKKEPSLDHYNYEKKIPEIFWYFTPISDDVYDLKCWVPKTSELPTCCATCDYYSPYLNCCFKKPTVACFYADVEDEPFEHVYHLSICDEYELNTNIKEAYRYNVQFF